MIESRSRSVSQKCSCGYEIGRIMERDGKALLSMPETAVLIERGIIACPSCKRELPFRSPKRMKHWRQH